jgi:hypothetical protein
MGRSSSLVIEMISTIRKFTESRDPRDAKVAAGLPVASNSLESCCILEVEQGEPNGNEACLFMRSSTRGDYIHGP